MLSRRLHFAGQVAVMFFAVIGVPLALSAPPLGAQARPTTRDSASVRIVEYATIKGAPVAFRIESPPLRSLGGLQTDLRAEFPSQTGNSWHKMADGRILVDGARDLKLFDATGRIVQLVGRMGQGPGEFVQNYMSHTCVIRGDTIVTVENGRGALQLFDKSGQFIRSFTLDRSVNQAAGNTCFRDGTFLVYSPTRAASAVPVAERLATYRRIRSDSSVVSTFGTFPTGLQTAISDTTVFVGAGSAADGPPQFRAFSISGRLRMIVRWKDSLEKAPERPPRTVPATSRAANAGQPIPPGPTTIAAYGTMYADPFGRLWLKDMLASTVQPAGWTVFSNAGVLLGRVVMPRFSTTFAKDARIIAFDGADVVVRWVDDDGVHITTHKLVSG